MLLKNRFFLAGLLHNLLVIWLFIWLFFSGVFFTISLLSMFHVKL